MADPLKIKDMPIDSRPREAFMRSADPVREISDEMLLAILIRTGQKGSSAIDIANRLIRHFGTTGNLVEASWQQIYAAHIPGVGKVAAVQLAAAFAFVRRSVRASHRSFARAIDTPEAVVRQLHSLMIDDRQEHFFILYLDTQRHLLCDPADILCGTTDRVLVHPREVFRNAIRIGAVSVVVAHNHPSGCATPSDADVDLTKRLLEAGRCVGIPLDDHIVVAKDEWVSMRACAILDFDGRV